MGRFGVDDVEDLRSLKLTADERAELLEGQTECTFIFAGEDGWPSGVIMSFMYADDHLWLTAVRARAHAKALVHDQRVSVVVSSKGTELEGRRMVAFRGEATLHDDAETKAWFLPRFTARLAPSSAAEFSRLLDSPNRVIIKVKPVAITASHDSRKMPGDGRGGPRHG